MVRLVPRETKFFDMFAEVSANLIDGARLMAEMLHDFKDIPGRVTIHFQQPRRQVADSVHMSVLLRRAIVHLTPRL